MTASKPMTDLMELADRLDSHMGKADMAEVLADCRKAAACIREMAAELDDARLSVRAFAAPWAVTFARDRGYPEGALHFDHYDTLAKAGARMTDFTRYLPPAPGAEDE